MGVGGAGAVGFPLLGLSLAGVFPSLVLLTPRRVGSARTPTVVGLQFSVASIGASGIPAAIGFLAEDDLVTTWQWYEAQEHGLGDRHAAQAHQDGGVSGKAAPPCRHA